MPKNRPYYISTFLDLVGPTHLWPNAIRPLICQKRHLTNKERFTVIMFLSANGVNPLLQQEFFKDIFNFDQGAWRQIEWLYDDAIRYRGKYKAWNVFEGRTVPVFILDRRYW